MKSHSAAIRQRDILRIIKTPGLHTAETLAEALRVTVRTVQFDLDAMRTAGLPVRVCGWYKGHQFASSPGPGSRVFQYSTEPDEVYVALPRSLHKRKRMVRGQDPTIFYSGVNHGEDDDEFERKRVEALREKARTHIPKPELLFGMFTNPLKVEP